MNFLLVPIFTPRSVRVLEEEPEAQGMIIPERGTVLVYRSQIQFGCENIATSTYPGRYCPGVSSRREEGH